MNCQFGTLTTAGFCVSSRISRSTYRARRPGQLRPGAVLVEKRITTNIARNEKHIKPALQQKSVELQDTLTILGLSCNIFGFCACYFCLRIFQTEISLPRRMEEIQQHTQDLGETSCSPEKLKKKLKMEKRREARRQKVLAQDQKIRELRQNGQIPHLSKAMLETILKKKKRKELYNKKRKELKKRKRREDEEMEDLVRKLAEQGLDGVTKKKDDQQQKMGKQVARKATMKGFQVWNFKGKKPRSTPAVRLTLKKTERKMREPGAEHPVFNNPKSGEISIYE